MRNDQHFTRSDVGDLLAALALRSGDTRVLDPACGDGALLRCAASRLEYLGESPDLRGVEVDPSLAGKARFTSGGAEIVTGDFFSLKNPASCDAIIGNPPYVRQERLDSSRKKALAADGPFRFSRRCDLHVYFWPRCLMLLRPGGTLGFLTSATWLDASYGRELRQWLAENFHVVAVVESQAESWFDHARIRTVITLVRKGPPSKATRFVRLSERLDTLVPPGLSRTNRLERFDRLARDILGETAKRGSTVTVRQSPAVRGGGRWSVPLRQPDLYFEILSRAGERLVPLGSVANVRWGIKTGDDGFFYLRGDKTTAVEERFLSPVVFNLMELDRLVVSRDQLKRRILLVDRRLQTTGSKLQGYIASAERVRRSHERPTCAARARNGRAWYELRPGRPGAILWSIMHQYRHLAPLNSDGFPANDNLLLINPHEGIHPRLLAALLNSHLQALLKYGHGRHRNEGMLKTQACDVREMLVVDPRRIDGSAARRLTEAFEALARRPSGSIPEECGRRDRRHLDREVLSLAGYTPAESGEVATRIAESLVELCQRERRCELDAVSRRRTRRQVEAAPDVLRPA